MEFFYSYSVLPVVVHKFWVWINLFVENSNITFNIRPLDRELTAILVSALRYEFKTDASH